MNPPETPGDLCRNPMDLQRLPGLRAPGLHAVASWAPLGGVESAVPRRRRRGEGGEGGGQDRQ
eukprot:2120865-Pyramimonas_sp.AAC.1